MKINELRIGNCILIDCIMYKEERKVTEICPDGVFAKTKYTANMPEIVFIKEDDIEPIELTEDFFKKHIKKLKEEYIVGNVTSCRLNENISIMFVDGKMNSLYIYDYDDENDSYFSIKIKYLHQLQNAYYCLTGQELEIEL